MPPCLRGKFFRSAVFGRGEFSLGAICLGLVLVLSGCVGRHGNSVGGSGPAELAPVRLEPWTLQGIPARRVITPHYVIYSTLPNDEFLESMGQLMEGALGQYQRLAPMAPPTERPMECYLFATRPQWARFTQEKTGQDASVYLQINRGGYTVRDWFVAYWLGDVGTFSVSSHEGFHQFAARHFRDRIPPFLEEGLACLFEDVSWDGRLPKWKFGVNEGRQAALRRASAGGQLLPLETLVSMHAGQVISRSPEQIAGFYAQGWAFARFLWEYDAGRYRPALRQLLYDASAGSLYGSADAAPAGGLYWNPRSAKPLLEHYLGQTLPTIDGQYQGFVRDLARESLSGSRSDGG